MLFGSQNAVFQNPPWGLITKMLKAIEVNLRSLQTSYPCVKEIPIHDWMFEVNTSRLFSKIIPV